MSIEQVNPAVAEAIRGILARQRAVLTDGHFVYNAGHHGPVYLDKDQVHPDPFEMFVVGQQIAGLMNDVEFNAVAGPTLGGAVVAQWVAYHTRLVRNGKGRQVLSLPCEKHGEGEAQVFRFRPVHAALVRGKKLLVVDDIVNSGKSLRLVAKAVREAGGEVLAASALADRSGSTAENLVVPAYWPALRLPLEKFHPSKCPLCLRGTPINTETGKGRDFVAGYGQPPYTPGLMETFRVTG